MVRMILSLLNMAFLNLSKRKIFLLLSVGIIFPIALFVYVYFNRKEHKDLSEYVSANTLVFIEVDNLANLSDIIFKSEGWSKVAPTVGLPQQLTYFSQVSRLLSNVDLGSIETVILNRAEFAIAIDGLDAETVQDKNSQQLDILPRFVLIIETHSSLEKRKSEIFDRAASLVERMAGKATHLSKKTENETDFHEYSLETKNRKIIIAVKDSKIFVSNNYNSISQTIDTIDKKIDSLSSDPNLQKSRKILKPDSPIFLFVNLKPLLKLSTSEVETFGGSENRDINNLSLIKL
ncbi:MAG: hypothetical protein JNN15_19375, partial [Blastocatellia bacterium]|nr:hypothetical protein [Blastocatellia bacterium]